VGGLNFVSRRGLLKMLRIDSPGHFGTTRLFDNSVQLHLRYIGKSKYNIWY